MDVACNAGGQARSEAGERSAPRLAGDGCMTAPRPQARWRPGRGAGTAAGGALARLLTAHATRSSDRTVRSFEHQRPFLCPAPVAGPGGCTDAPTSDPCRHDAASAPAGWPDPLHPCNGTPPAQRRRLRRRNRPRGCAGGRMFDRVAPDVPPAQPMAGSPTGICRGPGHGGLPVQSSMDRLIPAGTTRTAAVGGDDWVESVQCRVSLCSFPEYDRRSRATFYVSCATIR